MKIVPSILTDDIGQLTTLEGKAEGVVDRVQIDVIDNKFAANSTIDPAVLKNVVTILNLDFHLMVKDPDEWIEHCVVSPKNRIIGQIEYMKSQGGFVEKVKNYGCQVGLGVDLATDVEKLDQDVLPKVDLVLLMSVPAGFGGQEFNLDVFDKIEKVVKIRTLLKLDFKIQVDGGVTKELVAQMGGMGVDEVIVGRKIFEGDIKKNLEIFDGKN